LAGLENVIIGVAKAKERLKSACLGSDILFLLNPFLEAAFQYSPLTADLERGNLSVLNHPMQRALGYFKDASRFSKSKKSDRSIVLFHGFNAPRDR
jgi:hypothetical protein